MARKARLRGLIAVLINVYYPWGFTMLFHFKKVTSGQSAKILELLSTGEGGTSKERMRHICKMVYGEFAATVAALWINMTLAFRVVGLD